MSEGDWTQVLDAFEARLDAQTAALRERTTHPVEPFSAPAVATVLPPALVDRAVSLLRRCRALEEDIAAALADTAAAIARSDTDRDAQTGREPVYFDSRV